MEWLTTIWKEEQESLNRFDLLNIANALRLHQDASQAADIISDYKNLRIQGETFELQVGLGNIYYQQG
jgi:hypothetical protein